jgi:hypothetical protein
LQDCTTLPSRSTAAGTGTGYAGSRSAFAQHVPARSKRERIVHASDLLGLGETLMIEA